MPAESTSLVVDVGASRTRIAAVVDGRIGSRAERRTRELVDPARPERGIADRLADEALKLAQDCPRLPGSVGVSLAAAVDYDGSVLQPREFGIPGGSVLRDALATALRLPVAVDNDANCAALAEQRLGAASGCHWVAVLTLGTNIGLGLILDGRIVRGARGAAGVVGLLLVPNPNDPRRMSVGYRWIEEVIGGGALSEAAGGRKVLTAEAYRDPSLQPLADRALEGWSLIIADLMVLLDLEVVVLTGGLAADAAHLLDPLRRRVAELVAHAPEIQLGTLGPDAELLGADLIARAGLEHGPSAQAGAGPSAQTTGGRR